MLKQYIARIGNLYLWDDKLGYLITRVFGFDWCNYEWNSYGAKRFSLTIGRKRFFYLEWSKIGLWVQFCWEHPMKNYGTWIYSR